MAGEIFISYRRSDAAKARLLHALLKQRGVDAWYDALVGAGDDWRRSTMKALDAAPIFVLLFSKIASESQDISKELAAATFSNKLVIPVRIDNIKPQGAFLYELASRNWFDAFDDTEARFEILADKLAALVKGGPEADVAAFNLGAPQPPPVITLAAKPLLKRPVVLGSVAAAGVAVIAAVAMFAMGPQTGKTITPAAQRIGFFGFTLTSEEPSAKALAEAATDQMFQTMGLFKLDSAARDGSLGTPPDQRLTRANELGALYALSGEVRPDTDGMTLSIRLVDVPSRTTLWEQSFSGPASEAGFLPFQVAFPANDIMSCIVRYRSRQTQDTSQFLKLVAERCRQSATMSPDNVLNAISAARGLAQAEPSSAFMHAYLAVTLAISVQSIPASARPARIAEAEAALRRAIELEPKEPYLILARAKFAESTAVPLAEYDATLLDLLTQAEAQAQVQEIDSHILGVNSSGYASLLKLAGRWRASLPYASAAAANDPMLAQSNFGLPYAALGQSSRARDEYRQWFALNPAAATWRDWTFGAVFLGAGDAAGMLKSAPSFVPKSVVECYRDIQKAYVSKKPKARSLGAKRASECGDAGDLSPAAVLTSLAALGDLERAFALANGQPKLNSSSVGSHSISPNALFLPMSRAMRADPRFVPLVEKLGLMDYWRATKSQPDACETEDVPFCRELKKAAKP